MKPGDRFVVTVVPERARRYVIVGDKGIVTVQLFDGRYEIVGDDGTRLLRVTINGFNYLWNQDHLKPDTDPPPFFGPDVNSMVYWVRKLIQAERDLDVDAGMAALDQLRKLDQQLPADWPKETLL